MSLDRSIEIMRKAHNCNVCFEKIPQLRRTPGGLPKPRWIGKDYWTAKPRVLVVLPHPGSGRDRDNLFHEREIRDFGDFYRTGDYSYVQDYFYDRLGAQKNGDEKSLSLLWYIEVYGLEFDKFAQINMAWCATSHNLESTGQDGANKKRMLETCFEINTRALVDALNPDAVILSGRKDLEEFVPKFEEWYGSDRVKLVDNFSRRDTKSNFKAYRERESCKEVRKWLFRLGSEK